MIEEEEPNVIPSKRLLVPAILAAAAVVVSSPVPAAEDPIAQSLEKQVEAMRGNVMERRESAFKTLIPLDGEQATQFWPLKSQYDAELRKNGEAREALLREYAKVSRSLSAEQAKDLGMRSLKLDEDRNALRRKYFELMTEKVSPLAAGQFLQLERQFETMLDFKVQAIVPLAGP